MIGKSLNPLHQVRLTCNNVYSLSKHVKINDDAITSIANIMIKDGNNQNEKKFVSNVKKIFYFEWK